jgi:hypothetical protein
LKCQSYQSVEGHGIGILSEYDMRLRYCAME